MIKARLLATTALTALLILGPSDQAGAMPAAAPVLVGAALSGGMAAATTTAALALAAGLKAFALSAAMGFVSMALAPKAKSPDVQQGGFVGNSVGSNLDHGVIYGETRVGGVVFYLSTSNSETILHRNIAIAGHEIEGFTKFYANDEELTVESDGSVSAPERYAGNIYIETRLGTDTQAAINLHGFGSPVVMPADSDEWTDAHQAKGIAYFYSALKFDATAFPNGVPKITAVVKGRKVFDPRDGTTGWTENSALCLRDYLTSNIGLSCDADELDDVSFADAANDCDQSVGLVGGGSTSKRYTTNGSFTTGSTPNNAITQLLTGMGGMIWYSQGKFGCRAASWDAPVLSFSEHDMIEGMEITSRNSRRDQVNEMHGTFRGEESLWQETDFPPITSDVFLASDGGQVSILDMPLPFTSTSAMAQRIAKLALYRQREQIQVSITTGLSGFKAKIGDIIQLSNSRMGWSNKAFEVVNWTFGFGEGMSFAVSMALVEISETVYEWDADEKSFDQNNTTLLAPWIVPGVGVSLETELRLAKQSTIGVLLANITCQQPTRVSQVECQYKISSAPDSAFRTFSTGPVGEHEILGLTEGSLYIVRARAINTFGVIGDWSTSNAFQFDPLNSPPADVSNLEWTVASGSVFLKWTAIADLDALYYEIRHSSLTSGAAWGVSNALVQKVAHPTSQITEIAKTGTYMIKAVDRTGNYSVNAVGASILASELPSLGATTTTTENPDFGGAKTNISIATGPTPDELRMSSFASAGSIGTYLFEDHVDVGSTRTTTIDSIVTEKRHHSGATSGSVNWDDISSSFSWDGWVGNWDDWTDEDAVWNDYATVIYVRASLDAYGAGGQTWGGWTVVDGGQIIGRSFEFKAILSNSSTKVSPSLSVLKTTVSY